MNALDTSRPANSPIESTQSASALIFSSSGQICRGLLLLLKTVPQLTRIQTASDLEMALQICDIDNPMLILFDAPWHHQTCQTTSLPASEKSINSFCQLVEQIRQKGLHGRTIALLNNEKDASPLLRKEIDVVLLKGVSAAKMLETIEDLLQT